MGQAQSRTAEERPKAAEAPRLGSEITTSQKTVAGSIADPVGAETAEGKARTAVQALATELCAAQQAGLLSTLQGLGALRLRRGEEGYRIYRMPPARESLSVRDSP